MQWRGLHGYGSRRSRGLSQNVTRKLLHRRRHVPQRRCLVFIGNCARTVAADRVPHAGFNAGTRRQPLEGVPP